MTHPAWFDTDAIGLVAFVVAFVSVLALSWKAKTVIDMMKAAKAKSPMVMTPPE